MIRLFVAGCLLGLLCCFPFMVFSQKIIARSAVHFRVNTPQDSIDFIVVDTMLTQRKPVLLFCQGSLPMPLFFQEKSGKIYLIGGGCTNFDLHEIRKHYHLVIISMPHTPVVSPESHLNPQYCYVPDPAQPQVFEPAYVAADYLDNYVQRADKVWRFLRRQPWVDKRTLVVAGHSQGTKIATKIARSNKAVVKLGLFAANPFGRSDQFVRQARLDAQLGRISWEEADQQMEQEYQAFRDAHQPDSLARHPELKAWNTFSETFYDDWLALDIPIYLAYGAEDRTADLCDLMPLFFIKAGKNNLTLKRYLHLEHNFFEKDASGKTNYDNAHWPEVMHGFVEWLRA